ncbi:type II toxin-antitoxin system RelE/ParE family toxin [Streptomyces sp. NPDC001523]|uniref:type II toxin-antitoxin system RelE family toxin n=1 Tax=Streptomyces sp. NPDC001523 TaxID=3154383 RepID=UPI003328C506
MTYAIVWDEAAIDAATRFLKDDADGLRHLMDAVDLLADQPRPEGSAPYGSPDLRRMHVGRYRVLYEITETTVTVVSSTSAASADAPRQRITKGPDRSLVRPFVIPARPLVSIAPGLGQRPLERAWGPRFSV